MSARAGSVAPARVGADGRRRARLRGARTAASNGPGAAALEQSGRAIYLAPVSSTVDPRNMTLRDQDAEVADWLDRRFALNGAVDADSLRAAFEGMSFQGPKGIIDIRAEDHVAIQDMYIVKLLNVDDPEFRYYEYIETNRPNVPCLLPEELQDRCGDLPYGSLSGE